MPAVAGALALAKAYPWAAAFLGVEGVKMGLDYLPWFPLASGKRAELKLQGRQIDLQEAMMKAGVEGRKMAFKGQKEMTEKMMKQFMTVRREDKDTEKMMTALQLRAGGQQSQTAMLMQLMQSMTQLNQQSRPQPSRGPSASLVSLLR